MIFSGMLFSFTEITDNLQIQVLNKLDFLDYINFHKTCSSGKEIAESVVIHLPIYVDCTLFIFDIDNVKILKATGPDVTSYIEGVAFHGQPVRVVIKTIVIQKPMTEKMWNFLIDYLIKYRITAETFSQRTLYGTECSILISPEQFNQLLEMGRFKSFIHSYTEVINAEYFRQPATKKLRNITASTPIKNNDFLKLTASVLTLRNSLVTYTGVNKLLKEWLRGERDIKRMDICFEYIYPLDRDYYILQELPYTLLWTRMRHKESVLAHIPEDNLHVYFGKRFYGLSRASGEHLLICLWPQSVSIEQVEDLLKSFRNELRMDSNRTAWFSNADN